MYSPGSLAPEPVLPVSHQSSVQPESELFPEQPTNSSNTPINGPQDNPNENSPHQLETSDNLHDNAIDLDTSESQEDGLESHADVLTCHDVCHLETDTTLHEWNVFHVGTQSNQVCLAEDGMPFVDNPPEPLEHQCFMLEVPMSRQDILKWSSAEHPEELAQVASAGKRARA
jgi:hypothetical protein